MNIERSFTFDILEMKERSQSPDSGIGSSSDDETFSNAELHSKLENNLQDELLEAFSFLENDTQTDEKGTPGLRLSNSSPSGDFSPNNDFNLTSDFFTNYHSSPNSDFSSISDFSSNRVTIPDSDVCPTYYSIPSSDFNPNSDVSSSSDFSSKKDFNPGIDVCPSYYSNFKNGLSPSSDSSPVSDSSPISDSSPKSVVSSRKHSKNKNFNKANYKDLRPKFALDFNKSFFPLDEELNPESGNDFNSNSPESLKNRTGNFEKNFFNLFVINQSIFTYKFPEDDPFADFDFSNCQNEISQSATTPTRKSLKFNKACPDGTQSEFQRDFQNKKLKPESENKNSSTKTFDNFIDSILRIKNGIPMGEDADRLLPNVERNQTTDFCFDAIDVANIPDDVITSSDSFVDQISFESCYKKIMNQRSETKENNQLKNFNYLNELCDKLEHLSKLGKVNPKLVTEILLEKETLSLIKKKINAIDKGTLDLAKEIDECKKIDS